jgi:hypothetical protein
MDMKRIFFLAIIAISLVACSGKNNDKANDTSTNEIPQEKQLNISILLDLSDRISPNKNPDAQIKDIENIETITQFFTANMKLLNAYNAKGKIKVYLVPPPNNPDINSIVKTLNIDCSKMDNKGRKKVYDTLTALYTEKLKNIYNETIISSDWSGSDIWRFFKDDVKDYCIESSSDYRNILIILTDGYIFHEQSRYNFENRFSYLLNSNLSNYRRQNWKQLVDQRNFGMMTERDDLNDLEVLVLEVKADNRNNKIDEDILPFILKKWFGEMNVSRYEVYRSDLPANTKTRIEKFLN